MENFRFVLDPTGYHKSREATNRRLVEATGFLPAFALGDKDTIWQNMESNYAFFNSWTPAAATEATVDEQGVYHYPEDPDMHPLMLIEQGAEKVYIYSYGIVAVVEGGKFTKWTRMD